MTAMQVTQVQSLGQEDSLEKEREIHSNILAGKFHRPRSLVISDQKEKPCFAINCFSRLQSDITLSMHEANVIIKQEFDKVNFIIVQSLNCV